MLRPRRDIQNVTTLKYAIDFRVCDGSLFHSSQRVIAKNDIGGFRRHAPNEDRGPCGRELDGDDFAIGHVPINMIGEATVSTVKPR